MATNSKKKQKQYDEKRAGTRSRNWTVVFFVDELPSNFIEMIEETGIMATFSPVHNKDTNADGSPKKPHRHSILIFDSVKTVEQVYKFLGELFGTVTVEEFDEVFTDVNGNAVKTKTGEHQSVPGVPLPKRCENRVGMVRYFLHLDNPEKAQYEKSEIVCINGANVDEMLKSADEAFVLQATVESIIEEQGFTEYAVVAKYLRESDFDLYKTFTTHTLHFNAFISSRRHSSAGSSEGRSAL